MIQNFWNQQAKQYGSASAASTPDYLIKQLEMAALLKYVAADGPLLDIGCGNGILALFLAEQMGVQITGIDYAQAMIEQAKAAHAARRAALRGAVEFRAGDVLALQEAAGPMRFRQVISERCLINLTSVKEQVQAIRNIWGVLQDGGLYLMTECSKQGLEAINTLRAQFDLPAIAMRWHNLYLDETAILPAVSEWFELIEIDHFASTYYLVSRILNAKLTPAGQEPSYQAPINELAVRLPSLGQYAPHRLYVLKKKPAR